MKSFTTCLDRMADESGARAWVEKTPRHLWFIDAIEKYVEDPFFIHVVRRGEDVVASLYQVTHLYPEEWGGSRTLQACIDRWNRDIEITLAHQHKRNHRVVSYEDLTCRRDDTAARLFEAIGMPTNSGRLGEMRDVSEGEKIITEQEKWKREDRKKSKKEKERKYLSVLSKFQRMDVEENIRTYPI
mgnify:CR=1 FL=1